MGSIKARIIAAYTILFGLLLIGYAFAVYRLVEHAAIEEFDSRLQGYAFRVEAQLNEREALAEEQAEMEVPGTGPGRALAAGVTGSGWTPYPVEPLPSEGLPGGRMRLFTVSGRCIVADSLLARVPSQGLRKAAAGEVSFEVLRVGAESYRCLWRSIEVGTDRFVLEAAASTAPLGASLRSLAVRQGAAIPLVLLVAGVAAFYLSRAAFRPMTRMAATAREITSRNLSRRLALPTTNDEVRVLGETLNDMIQRIEAAFQSQKRFAADASHEIRTPLTVVQTELEYAEGKSRDAEVTESIRIALAEIDRLTRLTSSLLVLSRLDALQMPLRLSSTWLDEVLLECVSLIESQTVCRDVELQVSVTDRVEIQADREKLSSVFSNLLDNAVKYGGPGCTVSVSLARRSANAVAVVVADNGPGIPEGELDRVFDRFYRSPTARPGVEGSGLGLAIAREFLQMHGGGIRACSPPGGGSSFEVLLPVKAELSDASVRERDREDTKV